MPENIGISVEFSHHAGGARVRTRSTCGMPDALTTSDNIATFRTVVKGRARRGIYATFMPKVFAEHPGSGMHAYVALRGR